MIVFLLREAAKSRRFIISHDRDFGKLAINLHEPCYGVIYLRLRDQRFSHVVRVMQEFLDRNLGLHANTLIVIRESQARIRRIRS